MPEFDQLRRDAGRRFRRDRILGREHRNGNQFHPEFEEQLLHRREAAVRSHRRRVAAEPCGPERRCESTGRASPEPLRGSSRFRRACRAARTRTPAGCRALGVRSRRSAPRTAPAADRTSARAAYRSRRSRTSAGSPPWCPRGVGRQVDQVRDWACGGRSGSMSKSEARAMRRCRSRPVLNTSTL